MNTHSPVIYPTVGLDEVGRGAWAGPVVAGCCAFIVEPEYTFQTRKNGLNVFIIKGDDVLITDSKKMSAKQRLIANEWIHKHASALGIGVGSVTSINEKGIVKAAHRAFRSAFRKTQQNLSVPTKTVLLDAFYIPGLRNTPLSDQRPIVRGDQTELSIAAASIIAKVYRDQLMEKLATKRRLVSYDKYGWERNKGYGTKEHQAALQKYGTTQEHRTLFIRNCLGL